MLAQTIVEPLAILFAASLLAALAIVEIAESLPDAPRPAYGAPIMVEPFAGHSGGHTTWERGA